MVDDGGMMTVYLAYMDEEVQWHESLPVPVGTSILQALEHSGWLERDRLKEFVEWLKDAKNIQNPTHKAWYVGIYAQKRPINHVLEPNDRIELYRPLTLDPMGKRKHKSKAKQKSAKLT